MASYRMSRLWASDASRTGRQGNRPDAAKDAAIDLAGKIKAQKGRLPGGRIGRYKGVSSAVIGDKYLSIPWNGLCIGHR